MDQSITIRVGSQEIEINKIEQNDFPAVGCGEPGTAGNRTRCGDYYLRSLRRYSFRVDVNKDADIVALYDNIPQSLRGEFFRLAMRSGLDILADTDIYEALPGLNHPYSRYELIKAGLRLLAGLDQKKP